MTERTIQVEIGKVLEGQNNRKYVIDEFLAVGGYSNVFVATCQRTQTKYAAKFMMSPVDAQMEANFLLVMNELKLRHPEHLCRMCDIVAIDDFKNRGLIIQKGACSVYDLMEANTCEPMPGRHVKHIIYQLLCALQSLQEWNLVHVDVKPENVLFKNQTRFFRYEKDGKSHYELMNPVIMLCDFNCSQYAPDFSNYEDIVQTFHYRAPEVVLALPNNAHMDIFSTGAMMAELLSGLIVFDMEDKNEGKPTPRQRGAHILLMESVMGECPAATLKQSSLEYFHDENWRQDVPKPFINDAFILWRTAELDQDMLAVLDGIMAWPSTRLDACTVKRLAYFESRRNDDPREYVHMSETSPSEFVAVSSGDEMVVEEDEPSSG